jgi:general secretion pathway protein C
LVLLWSQKLSSAAEWMGELKSGQALARLFTARGAHMAAVVLLLLLGVDSALILTHLISQPTALPPPSASTPPTAFHPTVNPALQLAGILNAHLFGTAAVTVSGEARDTTMPLVLAGVIADQDPAKGEAIIGANPSAAKVYAVGGAIPGGARLHAVYADYVLLERNGALETLRLPHNAQPGGARAPMPAPTRTAALASNPTLLAGLVRIQPVFNQGKLNGYRIFPGGPKGVAAFTQLGLRPGDLIEGVNGTPLDDAARAMEVLQTLSSSATATVTVARNGQPQEVNLNLAALNIESDSGDTQANTPPEATPGNAPTTGPGSPGPGPQPGRVRRGGAILGAAPSPAPPDASNIDANSPGADAANAPERER